MNMHKRIVLVGFVIIVGLIGFTWAGSVDTSPAVQQAEIRLPKPETGRGMSLAEALNKRRSVRSFSDQSLSTEEISQLCWAAQGITQQERGLRTAPSALALFPVRIFVVERTGLSEYQPRSHSLRRLVKGNGLETLRAVAKQGPVASAPFCMILTIDVQRMVPRCGDRAERYSLLESGHIAQNVLLQATALGLASVPVGGVDEAKISMTMKLPAGLRPVYLLPIGHAKRN